MSHYESRLQCQSNHCRLRPFKQSFKGCAKAENIPLCQDLLTDPLTPIFPKVFECDPLNRPGLSEFPQLGIGYRSDRKPRSSYGGNQFPRESL